MASIWHAPLGKSVRGQSHILEGSDCEDAWLAQKSSTDNWTALCVSDGAGSARFGKVGAEIVVERFNEVLLEIAEKLTEKPPGSWVNDAVIEGVLSIRKQMKSLSGSEDISDYHATLVALLIGENGGFYVHLGDGAIFGSKLILSNSGDVEIERNSLISKPHNGEYSNETFFVTEHDWFKHLRMSPLPRVDWVALATDGGCELALTKTINDLELNDFFVPRLLMNIYSDELRDPCRILDTLLSDPNYDKLSQDDKTLVIIYKENAEFLRRNFKLTEQQVNNNINIEDKESSNKNIAPKELQKDINNQKSSGISKIFLLYIYTLIVTMILLYDLGSKSSLLTFNHKNILTEDKSNKVLLNIQQAENVPIKKTENQIINSNINNIDTKISNCDINIFFQDNITKRCGIKLTSFDAIISRNRDANNFNHLLKFIIEAIQKNIKDISSIELNSANKFFKNEKGEIDYKKLEALKLFMSDQAMMPIIKIYSVDDDKDYAITVIRK